MRTNASGFAGRGWMLPAPCRAAGRDSTYVVHVLLLQAHTAVIHLVGERFVNPVEWLGLRPMTRSRWSSAAAARAMASASGRRWAGCRFRLPCRIAPRCRSGPLSGRGS